MHTNTLTENLADIHAKDRFDVVLANPPFSGKERKEVQQNFPSPEEIIDEIADLDAESTEVLGGIRGLLK